MKEHSKIFRKIHEKFILFHKYRTNARKSHEEFHKIQDEINKKIKKEYIKNSEFEWYYRHIRYSRIFTIIFNIIVWFLIFRYFGAKAVAIGFAVTFGIGGLHQFLFNKNLEKEIFRPISKLKKGFDEISKGNYEVTVEDNADSEIKDLVDSFNEMAKKLNEGVKLKKAYEENRKLLIANISHDLKTPITSIQGYIETMLERQELPKDKINKYHKIIYNNSVYMNRLIEDLFLFSKLDMQKLELNLQKIDASAFMFDLMEEFKYDLEDRGIEFYYKEDLEKAFYINVDGKRVNQIFRNIIGNAIKYGYDNMRIEVTLYEGKNHVCIDVKDNGPGIPEDKLPNIFNRFYRIDHARTKDLMSTGLGLAIAKELVESHNGEIKVSSMEGIGTCFTIMLPKEMED
ncbi:HAMP domain-containing protein [Clostridium tyrobutyricum]|jgi:signal transduction histidine kinase|uniref:histidine kinase n=1 Tax=Clostridium tyrobutyricum DIVETGP TaxID=1408889 RepID=W6N8N7_CLOTY|nr:HAMP domain-containing sensor histidine kinase [Clostridium tyrobutyricum]AND84701.1 signal transduction histidine kinase [Clostridium tyrobutyricum]ANP70870.1 two-component sensor histidine kinase [Clostridium tyrobutyricum]MBV4435311.1 HAMP domain-containing histidine kinase [Clostridium tyrobutyricum]MCH4199561.1 HAMP domain-containing histidine kinase [Clostridium tyrobutyricum]MCH4259939.1 HAMP domain-containing histidine kinase [Clostridium tyrobutyricum]